MTQEALKLALEALEANYLLVNGTETHGGLEQCLDGYYSGCFDTDSINKQTEEAITAIKEALAQTQEPVAWGVFDDNLHDMFFAKEEAQEMVRLKNDGSTVKPLYTTPPQRTWVDLSDEERQEIALEVPIDAVLITEAKLKSKNNG